MIRLIPLVLVILLGCSVTEASAERASVLVAKTAVAAVTATVKAVPKAPKAAWRGLKWLIKHV